MGPPKLARGLPRSSVWPPPLPSRSRWSWLLGFGPRRWRLSRLVRAFVPFVPAAATVAEVGCGSALDARELAERLPSGAVRRWILLDPSVDMLRKARGVARHIAASGPGVPVELVRGDAVRLPFRAGVVDAGISVGVLCCLIDDAVAPAAAEAWRVSRPGAVWLFGVPRRRAERDTAAVLVAGFRWRLRLRAGAGVLERPGSTTGLPGPL